MTRSILRKNYKTIWDVLKYSLNKRIYDKMNIKCYIFYNNTDRLFIFKNVIYQFITIHLIICFHSYSKMSLKVRSHYLTAWLQKLQPTIIRDNVLFHFSSFKIFRTTYSVIFSFKKIADGKQMSRSIVDKKN